MSDDEGNIHHGIFDTDAPVGSASKDKVVSGIGLSRAIRIQPTGRVEFIGIVVDLGILERVVEGWDNHAAGGNGVIFRDGEGTGGLVGNL